MSQGKPLSGVKPLRGLIRIPRAPCLFARVEILERSLRHLCSQSPKATQHFDVFFEPLSEGGRSRHLRRFPKSLVAALEFRKWAVICPFIFLQDEIQDSRTARFVREPRTTAGNLPRESRL